PRGLVGFRQDGAQVLSLRQQSLCLCTTAEAALDDRGKPEDALVRFVGGHAKLRNKFAIRAPATGRPVVTGHAHAWAKQLASDFASDPIVGERATQGDGAKVIPKRATSKFVGDRVHAAAVVRMWGRDRSVA